MRHLSILGSTGSIGTQALDIIRGHRDEIIVEAISANKNIELVMQQILEFSPKLVCVYDKNQIDPLYKRLLEMNLPSIPQIVSGMDGLIQTATLEEANIVVTAIVGMVGIRICKRICPGMVAVGHGRQMDSC